MQFRKRSRLTGLAAIWLLAIAAADPVIVPPDAPAASSGSVPSASDPAPAATATAAPTYGPADPLALPPPGAAPAGVPKALAQAVQTAVETYPSVRAGKSAISAARSDLRAAKWQRFPTASLQGIGFAGGNQIAAQNNIGVDFVVDQPIWSGGRISSTIDRARAQVDVAQDQLSEDRQQIALNTIQAYFGMVRAAQRNAIMIEGRQALLGLVESIGRRVEQGVSPTADRILAQSRVAQLDQDIATNQAQYFSARERFRQLTGRPGATLEEVPDYREGSSYPDAARAFDEVGRCDPRTQRLSSEARVAAAEEKIAKAQIYPQVLAEFSQSEITGARAGIVLRAQANGGLSALSSLDAARARTAAAGYQIDVARRESREAISQDIVENLSARDRISSSDAAVTAARDVTDSYRRQFVAGRRTWLDVVNAEREAINAALGLSDSEVSAMESASRILIRTCRWQP